MLGSGRMLRRYVAALLVALLPGLAGCGRLREISACRGLTREVNGALDEIETLSKKTPVDEAAIARRYAALARALEPKAQGDKPLALAVRDYQTVLRATDAALRLHSDGTRAVGLRNAEARRELERLTKRERAAVTRIDVECHH